MRATWMMLLGVMGLGPVVACGGGDGEGAPNPVPLSNGTYQKPPSTYEPVESNPPPNDYQKPPNSYQPSDRGVTALCDDICKFVTLLSCATDGDQVPSAPECESSCQQKIWSQPCVAQLTDLIDCVFDAVDLSCMLLGDLESGNATGMDAQALQACQRAADAYTSCSEEKLPGPGNGACDQANNCSGCLDACSACGCVYADAPSMCTTICQ